jgi:hypothetical protein
VFSGKTKLIFKIFLTIKMEEKNTKYLEKKELELNYKLDHFVLESIEDFVIDENLCRYCIKYKKLKFKIPFVICGKCKKCIIEIMKNGKKNKYTGYDDKKYTMREILIKINKRLFKWKKPTTFYFPDHYEWTNLVKNNIGFVWDNNKYFYIYYIYFGVINGKLIPTTNMEEIYKYGYKLDIDIEKYKNNKGVKEITFENILDFWVDFCNAFIEYLKTKLTKEEINLIFFSKPEKKPAKKPEK